MGPLNSADVGMALLMVVGAYAYLRLLFALMRWAATDDTIFPQALSRAAQHEREAAFLAQFAPGRLEYQPHAPHVGADGTAHFFSGVGSAHAYAFCRSCGEDCLHDGRCCWCGHDPHADPADRSLRGVA